jgi:hypothetical protein
MCCVVLANIIFFCTVYMQQSIRLILYHISVVTQKYSYLYMHGMVLVRILFSSCCCFCCCFVVVAGAVVVHLPKRLSKIHSMMFALLLLLYISWQKIVRTARAQICRGAFPIASCHSMPNSLPKCHGISTLMTLKFTLTLQPGAKVAIAAIATTLLLCKFCSNLKNRYRINLSQISFHLHNCTSGYFHP